MGAALKPGSIGAEIADVDRRIEALEATGAGAEVEALQAVRAQLIAEQALARLFPAGSGFVREP